MGGPRPPAGGLKCASKRFEKYHSHRVVFDLHGMTMTDMFELLRGHELLDGMCCPSEGVEPMQEDLFQKFFQDLCGTQW